MSGGVLHLVARTSNGKDHELKDLECEGIETIKLSIDHFDLNNHLFKIPVYCDIVERIIIEYPQNYKMKNIKEIKLNDEKIEYRIKNNYVYLISRQINLLAPYMRYQINIYYYLEYTGRSPNMYMTCVFLNEHIRDKIRKNNPVMKKMKYGEEPKEFKFKNKINPKLNFPKVLSNIILDYTCPIQHIFENCPNLTEKYKISNSKKYFLYGDIKNVKSISIIYNHELLLKIDNRMLLIFKEIYKLGNGNITYLPFPCINAEHEINIEYFDPNYKIILATEDYYLNLKQPDQYPILQFDSVIQDITGSNEFDINFKGLTFQFIVIPMIDNKLIDKKYNLLDDVKIRLNGAELGYFPINHKFYNFDEPNFEIYLITFQNPYLFLRDNKFDIESNRFLSSSRIDNIKLSWIVNYPENNISLYVGQIRLNHILHNYNQYTIRFCYG